MKLSLVQIGILKDIAAHKIWLDEHISDFLRDQIIELATMDGPALIDTVGPNVILTAAGHALLAPVASKAVGLGILDADYASRTLSDLDK